MSLCRAIEEGIRHKPKGEFLDNRYRAFMVEIILLKAKHPQIIITKRFFLRVYAHAQRKCDCYVQNRKQGHH